MTHQEQSEAAQYIRQLQQENLTLLGRREWVGLTEDEKNNCLVEADPCEALATPEAQELMREVEAKLKEKNGAL